MTLPRWLGRGRDDFGVVVGGAFAVLLVAPFEQHYVRPVIVLLMAALLMFTLWTAGTSRRWLVVFGLLAAAAVVAATSSELRLAERGARITFSTLTVVLVLGVVVVIVRRVSTHLRVDLRTVCGALAVYVLLGLLFTYIDALLAETSGESFFAQPGDHSPVEFLYFSYATLTTVGYGDLSAANDPARMFAVIEALIGQLYLVTVVALVVSNIGRERHSRRSRASDEPPTPSGGPVTG